MKFQKKPVVIEAVRIPGPDEPVNELIEFLQPRELPYVHNHPSGEVYIDTLEGQMKGNPGDWLIRGVEGELYPCKDSIFQAIYEVVDETPLPPHMTEDFIVAEDGYVYFWQKGANGFLSAVNLRKIARLLDERNKNWDEEVAATLHQAER